MRSLVTGGDGFVGQHLIARLLEAGDEVAATTLGGAPAPGTLDPAAAARVEWRPVDVLDRGALHHVLADVAPARVFHLAGFSSAARARSQAAHALRVNAEGTLHLVEGLAGRGVRVVVAGSAAAYGDPEASGAGAGAEGRLDEDAPLAPDSLYGATKAAQELVALAAGAAVGVDVRVARFFPLVGPGQGEAFVLPSFCRRAARIARGEAEGPLRVGNLDVERDFLDVRDGAAALVRLAGLEAPGRRVYNVCSGRGTPVRKLLEWALEEAGIGPRLEVDPALVRAGEPPRVVGDPGRLAALGWAVERDLRSAVRDTYRWFEKATTTREAT